MSGLLGARRTMEHALRRSWRGEAGAGGRMISLLSLPLSTLYGGVVATRNAVFDRELLPAHRAPVPVVSVGNLAVGGTGKTPVAAWLVRMLLEAGARPALVARGYGEDELALHRLWNPDAPVHSDPDRVAACRAAALGGARSVVLDDGFQHRRLARDLDIVLLAAEHAFPGPLLPRGRFREPAAALDRADAVIVTRRTASPQRADELVEDVAHRAPHVLLARLDLVPGRWVDLDGKPVETPAGDALAVTAVAGPDDFVELVREVSGAHPELLAFPDHHPYDAGDAERIVRAAGPRPVVTTEKDAVKLRELRHLLPPVHVLPLEIRGGVGADALTARVRSTVDAPRGNENGRRSKGKTT